MKLKKNDLERFLQILSAERKVYAPVLTDGIPEYKFWQEGDRMFLEGYNTAKPPKDILFPDYESMYRFRTGHDAYVEETLPDVEDMILFGIRTCDVKSISSLDKAFLTKGYEDPYYKTRRDHVTIIAMGCVMPQETCFCDSMGLDPQDAPGADVMMNAGKDDYYFLDARTEKGEELLKTAGGLLEEGGQKGNEIKCRLKINKAPDLDRKLAGMFEDPIWDEVTKACIGCGTCTFVCPTCYCFDIDHERFGDEGCKYRCWDSCMFSDYTRMAGGHDPRPTKKERLRNRYMHKLSYFNERYGETLCTGCGRCIAKCPAHLDISEFIEKASAVADRA